MIPALLFLFAAVLFLAVTRSVYRFVFYVPAHRKLPDPHIMPAGAQYKQGTERMLALIDALEAIPFETVQISSRDGLTLLAKFYPAADPAAPLEIMFHGYRSCTVRDCCGGHKLAREAGHNILLVMQRAHEYSDGHTITFGIRERFDCLDWVNWACDRFGADIPILLSGVSMGGATVLMASDLPLPPNVRGIVSDCGYTSPCAIIRKVCRDLHLPLFAVYPLISLSARLYGHFNLKEADALEAVRHTKIPILFIHGEDDRFVPCDMARSLYEACASPKQILTVPDAGHGLSFILEPERYIQTVKDFQQQVLFRH